MKYGTRILGVALLLGLFTTGLAAQSTGAGRYDSVVQADVVRQLATRNEFRNLQAGVEDGIVTLTGSVDLYQQKLDAAKKVRKLAHVQGVRNLIEVGGPAVTDAQLEAQLDRKLYYDRMGYDNAFNYITVEARDGVVTLDGETYSPISSDSAMAIASNLPGVKDVVNNIAVAPVSGFDDGIRRRALSVIYRDPVLSRYAIDPARPIRILVTNGHLRLEGTVASAMDKQIAGIRAGQIAGVFSVQNNLEVAKKS